MKCPLLTPPWSSCFTFLYWWTGGGDLDQDLDPAGFFKLGSCLPYSTIQRKNVSLWFPAQGGRCFTEQKGRPVSGPLVPLTSSGPKLQGAEFWKVCSHSWLPVTQTSPERPPYLFINPGLSGSSLTEEETAIKHETCPQIKRGTTYSEGRLVGPERIILLEREPLKRVSVGMEYWAGAVSRTVTGSVRRTDVCMGRSDSSQGQKTLLNKRLLCSSDAQNMFYPIKLKYMTPFRIRVQI